MLHRIFGRSGYGKSEYLYAKMREIIECRPEREFDIYMIIPEQETVESERNVLTKLGNKSNLRVDIVNFTRLSDRVSRKTGGKHSVFADKTVKNLVMLKTLREIGGGAFGSFKKQIDICTASGNVEFVGQMTELIGQFKTGLVTPSSLENASEKLKQDENSSDLQSKLADLSLIYAAYESNFAEGGDLHDAADELRYLTELLDCEFYDSDCGVNRRFFDGKTVFIDSFDSFTNGQRDVVQRIIEQAEDVYIALGGDAPSDDERNIFYRTKRTADFLTDMCLRIGAEFEDVHLTEPKRFIASEIAFIERNLFNEEKLPESGAVDSIEVIECGRIFDEAEAAAEIIRSYVDSKRFDYSDIQIIAGDASNYDGIIQSVFERNGIPLYLAKRTAISVKPVMSMILSLFEMLALNFRMRSVLGFLKNGMSHLEPDEADDFEIYVSAWDISGFNRYNSEWKMHPDGYIAYTEKDEAIISYLERINAIRQKFIAPVEALRKRLQALRKDDTNTIRNISAALVEFLAGLGVYKRIEAERREQIAIGNLTEAEELSQVWNVLCGVIEKLVLVFGDEKLDLKSYAEIFKFVTADIDIGSIPTSVNEVSVISAANVGGTNPKCAILLGVNADIFPRTSDAQGIFSDRDKKTLKAIDIDYEFDSVELTYDGMYNFYRAATCASEKVVFIYGRTGGDGEALTPSHQLVSLMKRGKNIPFKVAGKTAGAFFSSDANASTAGFKDSVLSASRGYDDDTRVTLRLSPTKLEKYASCPFAYYAADVLNLRERDNSKVKRSDTGRFIHKILEDFMRRLFAHNHKLSEVGDGYIKSASAEITETVLRDLIHDFDEKTERFKYLLRKLKRTVCEIIMNLRGEFQSSSFTPVDFELKISPGGDGIEPFRAEIPNAGEIIITGITDRVDVYRDGGKVYLRVADYKTGSKTFNFSDVIVGMNLQMLIYLFAIWHGGDARYLHDGDDEIIPAGVIYTPSKLPVYSTDVYISEVEAEDEKRKKLKRSGLFLKDQKILDAMEKNLAGRYMPLKLTKTGGYEGLKSKSSAVLATFDQIGALEAKSANILRDIGRDIIKGKANISPMVKGGKSPCAYCEMRPVCRYEDGDKSARKTAKFEVEEVWEKLRSE
ncbi:ATP-dependent helicase/deoxyribonuclease subunit B [Clostridia bacterium]|nr:ATP-dependent helicase/deoxyribonuclease subunit B [Clostridia bacterium]